MALEDQLLGRAPLEIDVDLGGGGDHFVGHLAEEDLPDYVSSDEEDSDVEEGEVFVFEEEDWSEDSVDSGYGSKDEDNEDNEDDEDDEDDEGLHFPLVHQVPPAPAPAPVPTVAPQQPILLTQIPQLLWLPEQHEQEPEEDLDLVSHRLEDWIRRIREETIVAQVSPKRPRWNEEETPDWEPQVPVPSTSGHGREEDCRNSVPFTSPHLGASTGNSD